MLIVVNFDVSDFSTIQICYFYITNKNLTPWRTILPEKLMVTQLLKNSLPFMEPDGSLPCSQHPAASPYRETNESSPHLSVLFP